MQIKNNIKFVIILVIFTYMLNIELKADEFNISAKEILLDKDNKTLVGKGSVEATDSEGKIINADKITYDKSNEFLLAEGNVKIKDTEGNILISSRATYNKINELIISYDDSELILEDGYRLISKNISYEITKKILRSSEKATFSDLDGNVVNTTMFQYNINDSLFSSIGNIKIIDANKNKYFFKEIYVDTKKNEMIGSDVSVVLDQKTFGSYDESDPRFIANDILLTDNKATLSKGVFTVCKIRNGKCPPWSLKAKEITHDKLKKTIYYKNATLKVYDVPIFYFPRFFHPDPTVKRQSGFLNPFFTNSSNIGAGSGVPYFWAISNDKDLTFTPKIYRDENILLFNEYRQAFKNGFLTLDTSFTEGYKETTLKKTNGSRNHIFADFAYNFDKDNSYESDLSLKVQRTSNDTYFRIHDINTELVDSEETDLENEFRYSFNKSDMFVDVSANVFENLRGGKNSDRYEYILPNVIYGKTFFSENLGIFDFKSDAFYSNYETNKHKSFLTNDIVWNPSNIFSKNGIVSSFEGMLRNTNYETKNTGEYKDDGSVSEISGVLSYKNSLPLKKVEGMYSKLFSPNLMIRYAPGHMRDLSKQDISLNYTNLYSLNKTSEIEDGLSAIMGFEYKINEQSSNNKSNSKERFSLAIGQAFNYEKNQDMPSKSSLDQEMSDVVGEIDYNFSEIGKIDYKFSVDHNLNDINYNDFSTQLNFGTVKFNLDYLEQQNHVGNEHYVSSGITLDFDKYNKLSFSAKKNFKTESTEFYDINYQYGVDCLTAGLLYRREFYQDNDDLRPTNSLMFTLTFVPFTSVSTPLK